MPSHIRSTTVTALAANPPHYIVDDRGHFHPIGNVEPSSLIRGAYAIEIPVGTIYIDGDETVKVADRDDLVLEVRFTSTDIVSMADDNDVPEHTAINRANEWAKYVRDQLVQTGTFLFDNVVRDGQP